MDGCGKCNHPDGHDGLIGRDASGQWRTATKRAYREPLCRLLANALVRAQAPVVKSGLVERADGNVELPEAMLPFWMASERLPGAARCDYADLAGGGLGAAMGGGLNSRTQRRDQALRAVLAEDDFAQAVISDVGSVVAAANN